MPFLLNLKPISQAISQRDSRVDHDVEDDQPDRDEGNAAGTRLLVMGGGRGRPQG